MIRFESRSHPEHFLVQAEGNLSNADLEALVAEIGEIPDAVNHNALYDFSRVDGISGLSLGMMRRLSLLQTCDPAAAARQRVAIVVRGAGLYGMARILQSLMGGRRPHLRVFRDLSQAQAHLGIDTGVVPG